MRRILILAAFAILILSIWAAPTRAQSCYGESYSYGYGVGTTYYATGPAYSTAGSYTYAAPTVGSRMAYRAFHPLAGVRARIAARRALRGTYGVGGACYSEGYGGGGGCYSGGACYSAAYGGYGYGSYYAAPVHYHVAPMAYAPMAYQPATWAAPSVGPAVGPNVAQSPMPSPQSGAGTGVGTHPCPCGDEACNHTLGSCPCTDPQCKCHLPGPSVVPAPAPVAPHHPGKAVKP
jgi:hypothetical protein